MTSTPGGATERPDYQAMYEACKLQAQCHAQEARTANGTIAEIYQIVSGSTGEPGNWNGAEPVRAYIAARDSKLEAYRKALEDAALDFRAFADALREQGMNKLATVCEESEAVIRKALAAGG